MPPLIIAALWWEADLVYRRGGENIYPLEIEERLVQHPAVERAIVVGLPHPKYQVRGAQKKVWQHELSTNSTQEVPVAFLQRVLEAQRPSDESLREWTRLTLGRHKAPVHVFWLGEDGAPADVPMTVSSHRPSHRHILIMSW